MVTYFNYHSDEYGILEIAVSANVSWYDAISFYNNKEYREYEIENLDCIFFKNKECIHPDNIERYILDDIYEKAKQTLIANHGG